MNRVVTAVLVDDEPMGREFLTHELARIGGVEVTGAAADGATAVDVIRRLRPDVVFLDIEMPELSGIGVIRALEDRPLVVFVTAHDRFAVEAYELDVLDYLTKPIRRGRLEETLRRIRKELRRRASDEISPAQETPDRRTDAIVDESGRITRFVSRSGARIRLVRADAVHWASAAGNYVELHTGDETHLVRMTLSELQEGLDSARFQRIHRSHLVNLDRIAEIRSDGHGAWDVELLGGRILRLTPTFRDRLLGGP